MASQPDLETFGSAMRAWLREVYERAQHDGVETRGITKWWRNSAETYLYETRQEQVIKGETYSVVFHIPSWKAVEASANGGVLSPYFSDAIGTIYWRTHIDLRDFAIRTLDAALSVSVDGHAICLDQALDQRLAWLDSLVIDKTLSTERIVLFEGLYADDSVRLTDDVLLERLSDARLDTIVPFLIIPPEPERQNGTTWVVQVPLSKRFSLTSYINNDKLIGSERPMEMRDLAKTMDRQTKVFLDVVSAVTRERARVIGWLERPENPLLARTATYARLHSPLPASVYRSPCRLTNEKILQRSWQGLSEAYSNGVQRVIIGARMFGSATQAEIDDDVKLLHTIIAAEAILAQGDTQNPIQKTQLRASKWLTDALPDWTAASIGAVMQAAYRYRNSIVHGAPYDANAPVVLQGFKVSFEQIVESTMTIVQAALLKALDEVAENHLFNVDWEAVLEGPKDTLTLLREGRAWYDAHKEELIKQYPEAHIAILNGAVIDSDLEFAALSRRLREKYGNTPVYVPFTGDQRKNSGPDTDVRLER